MATLPPPQRWTVLVVDDDPDHVRICTDWLAHAGLRVVASADVPSALAHIRGERPDLVLLDLAMPGMSGWELVRELRASAETRDLPVLVFSAIDALDAAGEPMLGAVQGYLTKPCDPRDVAAAVFATLAMRRGTDDARDDRPG